MSKANPKTIADLKFNWTFIGYENDSLYDKEERFENQNKSLLKYKIKYGEYKFLVMMIILSFTVLWYSDRLNLSLSMLITNSVI